MKANKTQGTVFKKLKEFIPTMTHSDIKNNRQKPKEEIPSFCVDTKINPLKMNESNPHIIQRSLTPTTPREKNQVIDFGPNIKRRLSDQTLHPNKDQVHSNHTLKVFPFL